MVTAGWHHDGSRPTEVINIVDNNKECDRLDQYEELGVGVNTSNVFVSSFSITRNISN